MLPDENRNESKLIDDYQICSVFGFSDFIKFYRFIFFSKVDEHEKMFETELFVMQEKFPRTKKHNKIKFVPIRLRFRNRDPHWCLNKLVCVGERARASWWRKDEFERKCHTKGKKCHTKGRKCHTKGRKCHTCENLCHTQAKRVSHCGKVTVSHSIRDNLPQLCS